MLGGESFREVRRGLLRRQVACREQRNLSTCFMKQMRIIDRDAYWLDTRMTGNCAATEAFGKPVNPVICTMTAK
ncbi:MULTISPECIES: hypothetical protein [unclassified Streptomyces]|uniref:hypothetical protein n=1 Tax=unclassified Streptomyces TaxID=2593676 RepID=UPI002DD8F8E0|nr:hypothetical protein [Streptomyces sp. NBC_01750]WSA98075.1 hypothetical protein OIE54_01680 [Streptomyces sp. NBC_01794]WSD37388.1 hypothetical protein OG966_39105 [Streptomyces sp. NBC_01750]